MALELRRLGGSTTVLGLLRGSADRILQSARLVALAADASDLVVRKAANDLERSILVAETCASVLAGGAMDTEMAANVLQEATFPNALFAWFIAFPEAVGGLASDVDASSSATCIRSCEQGETVASSVPNLPRKAPPASLPLTLPLPSLPPRCSGAGRSCPSVDSAIMLRWHRARSDVPAVPVPRAQAAPPCCCRPPCAPTPRLGGRAGTAPNSG